MGEGSAVNLLVKYVLFFVNFILFIVYGASAALTAYLISLREVPIKSFFEFISDWSCVICVIAGYLCVMTLFGWLGALRENRTCLSVFKVLIAVVIVLELIFVILIFLLIFEPTVQGYIYDEDAYRKAIINYRDPQFEGLQETIETIQRDWHCCGVSNNNEGYKDWAVNEYFNCTADLPDLGEFCSVPHTCCKVENNQLENILCGKGMADPDTDAGLRESTIYTTGCFLRLQEILKDNIMWIAIVAIVVIIPEIFFFALTAKLSDQISKQMAKWQSSQQNFDRILK